jgi:hypothetical protein
MRYASWVFLSVCLALALGRGALADEQAEAKALLDRAIQALDSKGQLTRFKGQSIKGKGALRLEKETALSGEWFVQGLDQVRAVVEVQEDGMKSREVSVVNSKKGWVKTDDGESEDMDAETLASHREWVYACWVSSLVPLKEKVYQLSLLPESKVGKRTTVGLRVVRQGYPEVKLFFDKENALLLKMERPIKGEGDKEITEATICDNYKDFQGIQLPTKTTVLHDGKTVGHMEYTDYRFYDKLDDKLFAKP